MSKNLIKLFVPLYKISSTESFTIEQNTLIIIHGLYSKTLQQPDTINNWNCAMMNENQQRTERES